MAKLLYVEASPRKERSASIAAAKAFVDEYRKTHPGDTVDMLDLWTTPLPEFNGEVFTDITPIVVEPTLGKPESVERTKAEAAARARSVAGAF